MSHLFFSHSAQTMLPHSIPGAHASPTHLLCPKLSISTDILKELVKCMAGCRAAVHEVTNTLPAVQPARLHHKLLGASKVRHALCATWSHTCILFSAAQKSQTGYSLCTEVPSYTHEQRLSPDTVNSHVAPIDESAARVRCRQPVAAAESSTSAAKTHRMWMDSQGHLYRQACDSRSLVICKCHVTKDASTAL